MVAAIAITPTSGNITHAKTVCRIDVTGADVNNASAYDNTKYPTEPAYVYYLLMDGPVDDGKSYPFTPSSDGKHTFNNYIFPATGTYTLRLRNRADDSDAATASVVVA